MTKIPGLQNKKKKLLKKAQVQWCSGYHVCPNTQKAFSSIRINIRQSILMKTKNKDCTNILFAGKTIFQITPEKLPDT